ncbi:ABC transporter permease [Aeromicrobium panaciterrae]|uniref:ABC transporter permease n=1 Tax=Aeromicrobium panaciterrae TaxID=363861 RepID=UPI0031D30C2C
MTNTTKTPTVAAVRRRLLSGDQGYIVGGLLLLIILVASVTLDSFGSTTNLLNAARSASTLGILAIGMTVVVISRGLDLSVVMTMGVTSAFVVQYVVNGNAELAGLMWAFVIALMLGLVNGVLVAYVEIPALFVTLATALLYLGIFRMAYLKTEIMTVPSEAHFMRWLGRDSVIGVPNPVWLFALSAGLVGWLLSRNLGRYLYALGDNPEAARLAGLPVRPLTVFTYLVSAVAGFVGGISLVSVSGSVDLRTVAAGTLLYDVVAVVVIGGVSLAGGRGSIGGVVCAALLIGVIGNVMTLLNFDTIQQALAKAVIVMFAIVLDSVLHPRDEETARVGEL